MPSINPAKGLERVGREPSLGILMSIGFPFPAKNDKILLGREEDGLIS